MMRRLLIIALAIILPSCAVAQRKGFKLVESNPSSKPAWVTANERMDYIYVKGQEAATLADAKGLAMKGVVDEISQSVAVKVEGEIIDNSVMTINGNTSEFHEQYINNTKTKLAKMPALQGITIQKADVYYERYYNKKSGEEYYVVNLRYPFSEFERRDLIDAYNAQEKAINDKIAQLKDEVETVSSIEDINKNVAELSGLSKELGNEDARVHTINTVIGLYNEVCKSMMVEVVENRPSHMAVRIVYKDRLITTSQKPVVKSDCAMSFDVKYVNGICNVNFDSSYCYPQDEPVIKITFKAGNSKISKDIRIMFK
jgi:hypothetical protein